jgi:transcriptional regulator with PAS, ATPase and Fis domain
VRIVSATNRNLLEMVDEGTFRRDLYYRLAGHTVSLPPLRERKNDIPELLCYFMKELKKKASPAGDTLRLLQEYNYPGNIRELKYIIELALLKAADGYIYPEHLPDIVRQRQPHVRDTGSSDGRHNGDSPAPTASSTNGGAGPSQVLGMEVNQVLAKLQECRGSRRGAANELGISERKLYRLIKRFEEMGVVVPKPYQ